MLSGIDGDGTSDAFWIKDLWIPSDFSIAATNKKPDADNHGPNKVQDLLPLARLPEFKVPLLHLPNVDAFQYGALQDISVPESIDSSELAVLHLDSDEESVDTEDVWITQNDLPATKEGPRSWERFYDHSFQEPNPYLSESGSLCFNAALQQKDEVPTNIVKPEALLRDLYLLGLGHQSLFFSFDETNQKFSSRFGNVVIPGFSKQSMEGMISKFADIGLGFRNLRLFVEDSYRLPRSSATKIAFARSISASLEALQIILAELGSSTKSLLRLYLHFEKASALVKCLGSIATELQTLKTPASILSRLYEFAQETEYTDIWLQPLVCEILRHVSVPWLELVGSNLGLQAAYKFDFARGKELLEHAWEIADGFSNTGSQDFIPSFIADQDRERLLSTCVSLDLLRKYSQKHILSAFGRNQFTEGPKLQWQFNWHSLERVEQTAEEYETRLKVALKTKIDYISASGYGDIRNIRPWNPYGKSDKEIKAIISWNSLDYSANLQHPPSQTSFLEPIRHILHRDADQGSSIAFEPSLSLASINSFQPIISIQARIVNHAVLRMLFKDYELNKHLMLHRNFQLMGSGMFSTRLSNSLFSSDMSSAERRKGRARSGDLGLRLLSRSTWPPATSELQLALAGILVESYKEVFQPGSLESERAPRTLPGNLSFAIRNLSEPEIEACLNRHSLYALDFLRLQYQAPAPLDAVISPQSLEKYDSIFKLLLRLLRVKFVVVQLSSQAAFKRRSPSPRSYRQKFRIQASHFALAVTEYLNTAIAERWNLFWGTVVELDNRLNSEDGFDSLSERESIPNLKLLHERMLDDILFGLLLRKRQKAAMVLLEQILDDILGFAERSCTDEEASSLSQDQYDRFSNNIGVFVAVCRGLSTNAEYPGTNTLDQLLLRLDMNGWYSKEEV